MSDISVEKAGSMKPLSYQEEVKKDHESSFEVLSVTDEENKNSVV